LERFRIMSGLRVNVSKSSMFVASVSDLEREDMMEITGFKPGVFPFRYLGIPISDCGLKVIQFKPLLDKISGYLNAWAKKTISFAGRRELIASVLQGSAGFWLAILPAPTTVLNSLVSICTKFLWRRPRVRWTHLCVPRKEGGLGFLDFKVWNECFMVKYFWHILERRDSLWVRWVHHRCIGLGNPLEWCAHSGDSPLIKAIVRARARVEGIEGRTLSIPDTLSGWCMGDKFKVSKAYEELRARRPEVWWFGVVWPAHNAPKHSFILWLATLGRLSTYDRLLFLDVDPGCRLCGAELETHEHLYFECPYAAEVWRLARAQFRIPTEAASIQSSLRWLHGLARGDSCLAKARVYALSAAVYQLWLARNSRVFDNNLIPVEVVARLIISRVYTLLHQRFPFREVLAI